MPSNLPGRNFLSLAVLPVSLAAVRDMRERALRFLQSRWVPSAQQDDLALVISEYFTNVVKHSPGATHIEMGVSTFSGGVTFILRDNGSDISRLLAERKPLDTDTDDLPVSGLGLSLIGALVPDFRYTAGWPVAQYNEFEFDVMFAQHRSRIVIIDDDDTQLCLAEIFLSDEYNVTCFSDARRALAHIFLEGADLIISDIYMPDMDGILLRKRLAANDDTRLIPFIFLTGCGQASTREKVCMLSVDDVLVKPVEKDTLLSAVARVLHRARDVSASINISLDQNITEALWRPLPERYAGYRLSRDYRVAERGGGDLLIPLHSDAGMTMILMDVMGHGVQAKFFAHALAGYFHGLFAGFPHEADPGRYLQWLSETMNSHALLSGTLLTCVVVHITPAGRVSLASAGHPWPWLFRSGEAPQPVEVSGVLPGLGVSTTYRVVDMTLAPGESLLLFTDGLFESYGAGRVQGDSAEAMNSLARQFAARDVTAEGVMAVFDAMTQGAVLDDATALVIRRE